MKYGINNICYGFFSTLANPTRLAILEKLQYGPINVSGLAEYLDQEQSMVSHNLKLLERCNFINSERRGKEKYVSLNNGLIEPLFNLVEAHSDAYCGGGENCPFKK
jgi:DNA-binding transcriptional ArsR family regulator